MRSVVTLLTLISLAVPATTSAKPGFSHRKLKATTVFMHAGYTTSVGCVAAVFAQWKDEETTAERWDTNLHLTKGGTRPESGTLTPPYDDTFVQGGNVWKAPKGKHWALISRSWRSGGDPEQDCGEFEALERAAWAEPIFITVKETKAGLIAGDVTPVRAWDRPFRFNGRGIPQSPESLPSGVQSQLLAGLRVKAVGPHKKTFSAPVVGRSSGLASYSIKIPFKKLGAYTVSWSGPDGVALDPVNRIVRVKQGETERVDFESGYDCDSKPAELGFAPKSPIYSSDALALNYDCRSRRAKVGFDPSLAAGYDAQQQKLRCRTNPNKDTFVFPPTDPVIVSPTMTAANGGFGINDSDWQGGLFKSLVYSALFGRDEVAAQVSNAACDIDLKRTLTSQG